MRRRFSSIIAVLILITSALIGLSGCGTTGITEEDADLIDLRNWGSDNYSIGVRHSDRSAEFTLTVDGGGFYGDGGIYYSRSVVLNAGQYVRWDPKCYEDNPAIAYVDIIVKVNIRIVGYAVLQVDDPTNYEAGTVVKQPYTAKVLKSVLFSKIDNKPQSVTQRQVQSFISEVKVPQWHDAPSMITLPPYAWYSGYQDGFPIGYSHADEGTVFAFTTSSGSLMTSSGHYIGSDAIVNAVYNQESLNTVYWFYDDVISDVPLDTGEPAPPQQTGRAFISSVVRPPSNDVAIGFAVVMIYWTFEFATEPIYDFYLEALFAAVALQSVLFEEAVTLAKADAIVQKVITDNMAYVPPAVEMKPV